MTSLLSFGVTGLWTCCALIGIGNYLDFAANNVTKLSPLLLAVLIISWCMMLLFVISEKSSSCQNNNVLFLLLYTLVGAVVLAELGVAITASYYADRPEELIDDGFQQSLTKYNDTEKDKVFWDTMQTELTCCGVDNYADWYPVLNSTKVLPESCCSERSEEPCSEESQGLHRLGCLVALQKDLIFYLNLIAWGMCVNGAVQGLCMWCSFARRNIQYDSL